MHRGSSYDFSALAEGYDDWYDTPRGAVYDRLEREAIARVLPDPALGARLLEVGAGTGHWTALFASLGFEVVGVDVSAAMLRAACAKGIERARFVRADGAALPFPDGAFDVSAAVTVLEFASDPQALLGEMARCTRRGGRMVVGVLRKGTFSARRRVRSGSPLWHAARFFEAAELLSLLSRYGAARVEAAARVPPWGWLLPAAGLLERAGRIFGIPAGDFLVGEVDL